MDDPLLTIGQVADMTGISEPTLRAWERRHGFPAPVRSPGGRRSYRAEQVEQLRQVTAGRESGLSLEAAIDRAQHSTPASPTTVFASLSAEPGVRPVFIDKAHLTRVVHGLEDEMLASGTRPVVLAGFQRQRFFRQAEARYRRIADVSELVVARADFARRRESGSLIEVPLADGDPLLREWSFVCYAPGFTVALAAWEGVDQPSTLDRERRFELVWTAEAGPVRRATHTALLLAHAQAADLTDRAEAVLAAEPPVDSERYRRLAAMSNRVLSYLVSPDRQSEAAK